MRRLDGKVAIVTGGARGIGRAIVTKFASEGALVTVFDVDDAGGTKVVADAEASGLTVAFARVDITNDADIQRAVAQVVSRSDGIDILVNNAGVNTYFDAAAMTEAQWDAVFAVDLKGAWLCAKHVLPSMIARRRGS